MRITPTTRISLGLVSLTISLLLLGKIIGFAPDRTSAVIESRKTLSEALAIQFSAAANRGDVALIKATLKSIVERDNDITSAAIRNANGDLLAQAGDHLANWQQSEEGRSTPTHVQIPIFRGQERWATVEVSFPPLWVNNISSGFKNSYLSLILFISFTGFAGYFLLIKRTLRELDPSAVIPGRVQAAFDVLKEGVLILDENEHIVLANSAFSELVGKPAADLIGFKGSELGWKHFSSPQLMEELPWKQAMKGEKNITRVRLIMERENAPAAILIANAATVLDDKGNPRGVLVTFDNITEIEIKNRELSEVVSKLKMTTDDVQIKNKELEFLATRDPLTHLLNRRALNDEFEKAFVKAQKNESDLSCVMCDIDHFKSVNDRYGHATGDKVIEMVARLLYKNFRAHDLVGRYGGEEFCIILPDIELKLAYDICNRIRAAIKEDTSTGIQITISFGVSSLNSNVHDPGELANQADKALYIAKESGRNRVVCWGDDEVREFATNNHSRDDSVPDKTTAQSAVSAPEMVEASGHIENSSDLQRLNVRIRELEEIAEKRSQELEHYNAYDAQTGLPTRTLFNDRVSQALMRGRRYDNIVAVLSVSVDAVQRISETLGHKSGEWLLLEIGKRLTQTLRSMDTIAKFPSSSLTTTVSRLGQQDFGILLTDIEEVNAITWIVKRILNSLEKAFKIDDREIYTATNIGISIFPHDGATPEELVRNAAAAKSHSKKHLGENQYYFYSDTIHAASIKDLHIETQLHRAIENEEFLLHYQPKISTTSGNIIGVEALIRWENPETGLVAPYEFIPIAEYSGLITQIGDWVLSTSCRQVRTWLDMGMRECSVAVNFSNKQFRQRNLTSRIEELLRENDLSAEHLVIEVTENSMMENIDKSMEILHEIRDMGISIALDDFGTGYSSLGYLKNFPVTHVKIDRSFIADIETNERDATLVRSIINMAHGMNLQVTAEGVENEDQVSMLYDYGCNEMQGFLFSRPVPQQEATKLFQTGIKHLIEPWKKREAA